MKMPMRLLALLCACAGLSCASGIRAPDQTSRSAGTATCDGLPSDDANVYDTTQVTARPRLLTWRGPSYAPELRDRGTQGRVVLSFIVNADGTVEPTSITVVRSDDLGFEPEARRWAQGARFSPGCLSGRPVRVRLAVPVDFRISGRE